MYTADELPLSEWLAPAHLEEVVARVIADYKEEQGMDTTAPLPVKAVTSWLREKLGGDRVVPPVHTLLDWRTAGYLVPAHPPTAGPYMNVEAIPGISTLTPMVLNPNSMPEAASLQARVLGINLTALKKEDANKNHKKKKDGKKVEDQKDKKRKDQDDIDQDDIDQDDIDQDDKGGDETVNDGNDGIAAGEDGNGAGEDAEDDAWSDISGFEVDVEGDKSIFDTALEKSSCESESESEEVATFASNVAVDSQKDLDALLDQTAGLSVLQTSADAPTSASGKKKFYSYTDVSTKRDAAVKPSRVAPMIRALIERDSTQKHSMNDLQERRKFEKERRQNELDAFYGMKRQTITPEMRQELQALSLRGFVDPIHTHYRGSKRQLDLANAESGFFEVGTVVAGGIHDRAMHADGSTAVTSDGSGRKKAKSLVKSILLQK